MHEIHIGTNRPYLKYGIGLGVFVLFCALFILIAHGPTTESVIIICFVPFLIVGSIYMIRDKRPYLKIGIYGVVGRSWRGRVATWDDITDIDFYNPGRNLQSIRIKTVNGQRLIPLAHVRIPWDDLMELLIKMKNMPHHERERFIEHVNELHDSRGIPSN